MIKPINAVKAYWSACTVTILTAITLLSLWPLDTLPAVPGTDKSHHLIAYALLMLPTALRKPNNWIAYALFFIAYSGVIELIQPFFNRYGEWMDMLANAAGVTCGIIIAKLINLFAAYRQDRHR
jgi:VanZ family protein